MLVLALIGIAAAITRAVLMPNAATQLEPVRQAILQAVYGGDVALPSRTADLARFDGPFGTHPLATLAHILAGAILLAFVPLQLSATIRSRYPAAHRWTGRALIVLAIWIGWAITLAGTEWWIRRTRSSLASLPHRWHA